MFDEEIIAMKDEEIIAMKKVVLGSMMFLAGILSVAVIFSSSMANEWTINGQFSAMWNIQQYGLMPFVYIFGGVSSVGLALAVWGLFDKSIHPSSFIFA